MKKLILITSLAFGPGAAFGEIHDLPGHMDAFQLQKSIESKNLENGDLEQALMKKKVAKVEVVDKEQKDFQIKLIPRHMVANK